MKNSIWFALSVACITVAGCGSSENTSSASIDQQGNCTAAFVSDYNSVISQANLTGARLAGSWNSEYEKLNSVQTLKNACDKFFAKHGNVSCKAELQYRETQINSNNLKASCDAAEKYLAPATQSTPTPNLTKPTEKPEDIQRTGDSRLVKNINKTKMQFKVLNPTKLAESARLIMYENLIYLGEIHTSSTLPKEARAYCYLSKEGTNNILNLQLGTIFVPSSEYYTLISSKNHFSYISGEFGPQKEGNITIVCKSEEALTIKDIRDNFKGILDLTILE